MSTISFNRSWVRAGRQGDFQLRMSYLGENTIAELLQVISRAVASRSHDVAQTRGTVGVSEPSWARLNVGSRC